MNNKFERILLSALLGLTILLGLSFWLNTFFNFNIFSRNHWDELAKLQASQIPINNTFYISIGVAIFIFALGLFLIYRQGTRKNQKVNDRENIISFIQQTEKTQTVSEKTPETPVIQMNRPPRLNLPSNMAQIAAQKQTQQTINQPKTENKPSTNPYNPIISEILSNNGYIVKQNPTISGFVPNLFAIGNNEIVWMGGVDCDINKMQSSVQKLQSVFKETLEDIPIHVHTFILDTMNKYDRSNEGILIFKSIEELKQFFTEHPADIIEESDQENFDSYSEYIDTIIRYIKNV